MDFAINTVYSSERTNLINAPMLILNNGLRLLRGKSDPSPFSESIHVPKQRIEETDSVYNGSSITLSESASMTVNTKSVAKLKSFLNLEPNWDGYGAETFSRTYISRALYYLKQFTHKTEVFPSADGLVKFEFHRDNGAYLEVELGDDGTLECYEINSDGSDREFSDCEEAILRIVENFYD